ncbi:DinB family protein [Formosa algae]|uniref:DinB family protein n=1 Tax=Formosa algae TaxID=225843 RepID=UPI0015596ADB|nr:DinB family protein [Formosa algae]
MEKYIKELEQNANKLLETVKEYSIEKLTEKSGSEWSLLEILEHIYITDKVIYSIISKPSDKESKAKELFGQNKLEIILIDQRDKKIQSPDFLHPKGHFKNLSDFNSEFIDLRNSLKNDLITEKVKIDNRIHNHPLLGEMTITDWLNFILFHTERHLKQIEERNTVANNV